MVREKIKDFEVEGAEVQALVLVLCDLTSSLMSPCLSSHLNLSPPHKQRPRHRLACNSGRVTERRTSQWNIRQGIPNKDVLSSKSLLQ